MRKTLLSSLVLGLALSTFVAPTTRAEDPPASQPAAKDPVDYKKLKELLPDTFAGIKRSKASGQKGGMMGMKISSAEGEYQVEGKDAHAHITITDYAAMPQMAQGMAAWSGMEIDNDSDTEFTKTLTLNGGYKAMETFKKEPKEGSITVAVGSRFIVVIESTGADADTFKAEVDKFDFKKLAGLDK